MIAVFPSKRQSDTHPVPFSIRYDSPVRRVTIALCRSQIESSYSQPSRKFRFLGRVTGPDGNVRIASPGVAPGGVVQSRGDGVGSEAIGGSPPVTQNP